MSKGQITRIETSRSEFRFIAERDGQVIADTRDFDTALAAFKVSERDAVQLIVSESA